MLPSSPAMRACKHLVTLLPDRRSSVTAVTSVPLATLVVFVCLRDLDVSARVDTLCNLVLACLIR